MKIDRGNKEALVTDAYLLHVDKSEQITERKNVNQKQVTVNLTIIYW